MALIPWRNKSGDGGGELTPLTALRNEMDRLFDSFVRTPWGSLDWPFSAGQVGFPAMDIAESEDEVTIRAEVPGVDPKELSISLTGDQLVLSGEKKESSEHQGKGFRQTETRYGSFRRAVSLPAEVDSENVEADYANGVLMVRLKKVQKVPPKRIDVKVK